MDDNKAPATKQDVIDAIVEITPGIISRIVTKVVDDVVSGATTEVLNAMAEEFSKRDKKFDKLETRFDKQEKTVDRIENKLDPIVDKVTDHELRIQRLEAKPA